MKERPILFSAPMVRALLAGTKTQTRRVVKPQPTHFNPAGTPRRVVPAGGPSDVIACPYGQPGEKLWVRETFRKIDGQTRPWIETDYRATYQQGDRLGDVVGMKLPRWTPAIHMPRAASRITLEVTGVRVERLQDISEADALAEGVMSWADAACAMGNPRGLDALAYFGLLWESINGPGSWDANPWVWVVEFKRAGS